MDGIDFNGHKIEGRADGSSKIITKDGLIVEIEKDGKIQFNPDVIKSVGIENIFDLKSHVIKRKGELFIYKVEFNDGGHVKIVFTNSGKLKEFSGHNIGQTITKGSEIIIRSSSSAEALKT